MNIPSREECLQFLRDNDTPENIIAHTNTVSKVAEDIIHKLEKKGIKINKKLVIAGALLHDIEKLKPDHPIRGAELLLKKGYPEVANLIRKHSMYKLPENEYPSTWEEKIVYYSDKRVKNNTIVTVEERYEDLRVRYKVPFLEKEYNFAKKIEKELQGA